MKKPKVTETITGDDDRTLVDRISELPDPLLIQILSFLPTKDAFITRVISTRWQYLWTYISDLTLICLSIYSKDLNFISFVNFVLSQRCTSSKIKKFHLKVSNKCWYDLEIRKWLTYVLENKVESIVLESVFMIMYKLPSFFCTCDSLIELYLTRCKFDKGVVISWKSLKTVKFKDVKLDDEVIMQLLLGCPVLETIEMSFCSGFHRLEITSSNFKLKTVKLEDCRGGDHHSLEIIAPYLQRLEISGSIGLIKYYRLVNVSSLVSAELTFGTRCDIWADFVEDVGDYKCRDYHQIVQTLVENYLQKLSHVTELTIGSWFVEVLYKLQLDRVPLPELRCKCLTLKLQLTDCNLSGVATILQAFIHVETLNIDMQDDDHHFHCRYDRSYLDKEDNIDLESWISNFAFPSLKNINIICSFGMCWEERRHKLFELSQFLLKNASVLEKLLIIAKRRKCRLCSEKCVSPYLSQLAAKIEGWRISSTKFMMVFRESAIDA